jgi:hypothetical protein
MDLRSGLLVLAAGSFGVAADWPIDYAELEPS